jgi:hypothetical protein
MTYYFQIGNKKIKLLTEYERVTQKVLFGNTVLAAFSSIDTTANKTFYFVVTGLKIISQGNHDNN